MKRISILAVVAAAVILSAPILALAQNGAATTTAAKPAAKQMSTPTAKPAKEHRVRVDLNTASKDDLMKLKGITEADAEKIIAARPFKSASELKTKKLITAAQYSAIHGWVTVKKAAAAKK